MLRRILTMVMLGALVAGLGVILPPSSVVRAESEAATSDEGTAPLDRIVFTNGNVLECRILEETPTTVKVTLYFNGIEAGEQTYQKTHIIEIQRGVGAEASSASREEGMVKDDEPEEEEALPDAALVYMVEFEGQFGSDISQTPLREMFEDIDEVFDDLVEGTLDGVRTEVVDPAVRNKHIVVIKMDCGTDPRLGFDGIWRFKDIDEEVFEHEFKKGRRIVFWVKDARDGAAIVPWISPEIYFEPDGRMWFTSDLNNFDIGDDVVDEKQISLRIAQARSYAIEGGYDNLSNAIIQTMVRSKYWLYWRFERGEPVFHQGELEPAEVESGGWTLLSDNGNGDNEDKGIRTFNDRLVIDAELAELIGLSKGIAESEEDLMYAMKVHRNYKIVEGKAERIFEKWKDAKEQAIGRINRDDGTLWIEFGRIEINGDYRDRKRARGRKINILKEIHSDYARFAEVWDPHGQARSRISTMIEHLKKDQQADKAAQRAQRG